MTMQVRLSSHPFFLILSITLLVPHLLRILTPKLCNSQFLFMLYFLLHFSLNSMYPCIPQCVRSVYTSKIISSDKDLVALVFYGTKHSKNPQNTFKHVYVYHDLDSPGRFAGMKHTLVVYRPVCFLYPYLFLCLQSSPMSPVLSFSHPVSLSLQVPNGSRKWRACVGRREPAWQQRPWAVGTPLWATPSGAAPTSTVTSSSASHTNAS